MNRIPIDTSLSAKEISEKYGIHLSKSYAAKRRGYTVEKYNPENDPKLVLMRKYNCSKTVAESILIGKREDKPLRKRRVFLGPVTPDQIIIPATIVSKKYCHIYKLWKYYDDIFQDVCVRVLEFSGHKNFKFPGFRVNVARFECIDRVTKLIKHLDRERLTLDGRLPVL